MKRNTLKKHITPIIMQSETEDCGVACLAMILGSYKKFVSLESLRQTCNSGRDGTTALQICNTAEIYNLSTNPSSCNLSYLKKDCTYPCIIHWNFNHFVVLDGFLGSKAIINDPARGRIIISPEELSKSFTGICIEFKPNSQFKPEGKRWKPKDYIISVVKANFPATILLTLSAILASLSAILIPFFYKYFLDYLLTDKNSNTKLFFTSLILVAIFRTAANGLFEKVRRWYQNSLKATTTINYMNHCLRLPLSFFSGRYSSELIARSDDNDFIIDTIAQQLISTFTSVLLLVIYAIIMVRYSLYISLLSIPIIILEMICYYFINKFQNQVIAKTFQAENKITSTTINGIEMIETIKALGAENGFFTNWAGLKSQIFNTKSKYAHNQTLNSFLPSFINQIANILILSLGIFAIVKGNMTIGTLMAFQAFFSNFLTPTQDILRNNNKLNKLNTLLSRHIDINSYPEDEELENEELDCPALPSGKIELINVTFGYSKSLAPLLTNFSLTIEKGQKVAFVGLSGSGKSTIFKLITGLYQPWSGKILFDGKPRSAFNHSQLIKAVAVSGQDNIFFKDTISDNISMWDESIKQEDIIKCCQKAYIHDSITRRTRGYSEIITEHGKNFSGGELQRIEVARILASKANIFLLDETTSALDAKTEAQVLKSIFEREATTIIISHRISAIKDVNKILVFENGKIVEEGTHNSLFSANGLYSKLVTTE